MIVSPETVVGSHRRRFRMFWRLLYVLLVVRHERRMVVHWNITESPTTAWSRSASRGGVPVRFRARLSGARS